jgi:hypothetical protein
MISLGMLIAATTVGGAWLQADGPDLGKTPPPKSQQAWTLEEARVRLQFDPQDVYLQYVALQLARNENKTDEVAREIENATRPGWRRGPERRVDLFDLFSGALAVQESLQLDTMRGRESQWLAAANDPARNTVRVAGLSGPTVKSHPWGEMLAAQTIAGKKPEVSPLSLCVHEDQSYVEFRTLSKLLEIVETGDLWGDHFFNQAAKSAQTQCSSDKLKTQLAIQTDPLSRPFYDMVVSEVVMTGNDIYFREGTDVTILFQLKQPEIFRKRMDGYLDAALKSRPDAVRSTGQMLGVDYVQVATPDRAISAFSANPRRDLHVRSNSKAGLTRVLAAITGQKGVTRLGESTEFKYIRTLMVRGDKREDGFLYLSDPFIRRLVGPEIKLTERRRMLCYNHLRMIGHAAMLYRTQYGRDAKSLAELTDGGCLPKFSERDTLFCPCGGKYSLSADSTTGVCSYHGHARQMVPCLEIPQERVTDQEAQEYKQFVTQYSLLWRQYFDPIAIRLQATPKQYRAETIILPLIDNSVYSGMAMSLGGEPEPLDALPVPKRNIFTIAARVNKEALLKQTNFVEGMLRDIEREGLKQDLTAADLREFITKGLGNQVSLNVYDASPMFDFNMPGFMGETMRMFGVRSGRVREEMFIASFLISSLNSPVYVALPVKDPEVVDKFLDKMDRSLAALARRSERGFIDFKYDFYKVPLAGTDKRIRCYAIGLENVVKWRMFIGRIDNGLYIASKQAILEDLAKAGAAGKASESTASRQTGPEAHAMVRVRAENWKEVLPEYRLGWEENTREACLNNLGPLSSVSRALAAMRGGAVKPEELLHQADALHAVHFFCPDGGKYTPSADGKQVSCTIHGSADAPRQLPGPAPRSPTGRLMNEFGGLTAELIFLQDGLHAVITINRK